MEKADRLAYARRAYDRNIRMLVAALKRTGLYRVRVNCVGEVLEVQRARSARDGGLCALELLALQMLKDLVLAPGGRAAEPYGRPGGGTLNGRRSGLAVAAPTWTSLFSNF